VRKSVLAILLVLFGLDAYFIYGMIGWNIAISFTDWRGAIPSYNLVGLANYSRMLGDSLFWRSLLNTLILFTAVPCSLGVGFLLAILLNQGVRGARFFTLIFLMPFAFSLVVTGTVWAWILAPVNGAVNMILRSIGLGSLACGWYTDPATVMPSIIIAMVWQFSGYCALVLYAGMRSIPKEEIEAAKAEGASTLTVYRRVVLPRLKIPILTSVVVVIIFTLKAAFDLVWTMTGGGPGTTSYNLPILVVNETYMKLHVAYGAAISNILVAIVLCIIIPYVWWSYRGDSR